MRRCLNARGEQDDDGDTCEEETDAASGGEANMARAYDPVQGGNTEERHSPTVLPESVLHRQPLLDRLLRFLGDLSFFSLCAPREKQEFGRAQADARGTRRISRK